MDIAKALSKNLKSCREEKHLSQREYCQELGIAKSTLQKLEEGEPVSSQTLLHVIERLGMELVLRPREQRKEGVTAEDMIAAFLQNLKYCDLTDSQRKGLEEMMGGVRLLLDSKD